MTAADYVAADLRDFTWELRGGIMVSVPRRIDAPPAPKWEKVHDLIACPTCRARVDEPCRSKAGHTRTNHTARLAPRLCSCGELVEWRRRFCAPCRRKRDQASKNESARLKRQRARARYA